MKPSGSCLESCSGTVERSKAWHLARKSFKVVASRVGSCWLSPASWNLSPKGREKTESNLPQWETTENPHRSPGERQGKILARLLPLAYCFISLVVWILVQASVSLTQKILMPEEVSPE